MNITIAQTNHVPVHPHAGASTRRPGLSFAAFGRWLAMALVAGFTLDAQAQTTATRRPRFSLAA